jgi:hypothetical protein
MAGVAAVLSTISGIPARFAIAASADQVGHNELRIGQALHEDRLGLGTNGGLHVCQVTDINELGDNPKPRQCDLEQVVCPTIEARRRHHLVTGSQDGDERQGLGSLPRGCRERRHPALERGDPLLEDVVGGVHDARVDVSELLERKQRRCMIRIPELVTCGLIDWNRARPRRRIRSVASMQSEGLEAGGVGGHGGSSVTVILLRDSG